MDPCHSVSPRSPARTSTVTVAHLIRNIEQLKNKDKLISQLEKDLGHQWVSAQQAALERTAVTTTTPTTTAANATTPDASFCGGGSSGGGCGSVGTSTFGTSGGREEGGESTRPGLQGARPTATGLCLGGQQHGLDSGLTLSLSPGLAVPSAPAHPPLGSGEDDHTDFSTRTPSSAATTGSVEDVWSPSVEGYPLSKQDLQKALKESKGRNKELLEKCRAYLHRTKELTAQNRAYKDSSVKLLEENKKMQELLEHSKLRCLQLSRQANAASAERTWAQQTSHIMEHAKEELAEAHKTIAALRQACSDKDRRIELIQHRKNRRRLAGAQERSLGGETYFGYEDDRQSMDSSASRSTMSDDDVWDDVMSREETERNYQRLMMEHMQLQRSLTMLQTQTANMQDPEREEKAKEQLQNDLFQAQCRAEKLEMLLGELNEGEVKTLMKEREIMMSNIRALQRKADSSGQELKRVQKELNQVTKRAEDLEFQLLEMEQQLEDRARNPPCVEPTPSPVNPRWESEQLQSSHPASLTECAHDGSSGRDGGEVRGQSQGHPEREGGDGEDQSESENEARRGGSTGGSSTAEGLRLLLGCLQRQQEKLREDLAYSPEMERLRPDLFSLLKGRGREADSVMKRFDNIAKEDKERCEALEYMAHELQMKVISLQQDMGSPQAKGQSSNQTGNSMASALDKEKQENLELKAELAKLARSENVLESEKKLREELTDWKAHYERLKHKVELLTQELQKYRQQQTPTTSEISVQTSSCHSSTATMRTPPSPPLTELTRKNSKDRKSRPRSDEGGDDFTAKKRRRSSHGVCSSLDSGGLPPISGVSLKNARSLGDLKSGTCTYDHHRPGCAVGHFKSAPDMKNTTQVYSFTEQDKENRHMTALEDELRRKDSEIAQMKEQLHRAALEKSSETEADQGRQHALLVEKMTRLGAEAAFLRVENEALSARLKQQRLNEDAMSDCSSLSQNTEMEECLENLREQIAAREVAERQLRERLRLVEASAEEAESAELSAREKFEGLLAREAENSRQVRQLQQTCRELTDILVDKDIMEQGLTDKVDFLQRAEAAAVQRGEELEAVVKDLRAQLQEVARAADEFDQNGANQRELNKIQELKHQMTFLETDNKALQARVSELEENEETLRENWRRVAEEDFSRIQGLEEKVKNLEHMNKQLKADVVEAQEYFVINTVPETSLAAELAQSQSARPTDAPGEQHGSTESGADGEIPETGGLGIVRKDSERRTLRDKLKSLERQLSDVSEKKNSTIENLQEKIVEMKENEIKLSETISEMEMTEREIRAKLALYESSEVTVEKMLKYQSKIEELRTSQESLLDQLETMENQEMTLQEKMQEMERTLRGKIVTLEVEIKGFKTRELKDAARIRELEKLEKDLSEKTAMQAEKENGLYVKISSLMDEVKMAKGQVENLRAQLTDKEDKVRKAKLLEVKFLEIEMEFGKKMSDLSTKLRHKEEELRQKEVAHEEEIRALREESLKEETELNNKVASLEAQISEKENETVHTISSLNKQVSDVSDERDAFESKLAGVDGENQRLRHRQAELEEEVSSLKEELSGLSAFESESQRMVQQLQENLESEKSFSEEAENKVKSLMEQVAVGKDRMSALETEVASLKNDLAEKEKNIEVNLEKETELEKEKATLMDELNVKTKQVADLEQQLQEQRKCVSDLEAKCDLLRSESELAQQRSTEAEAVSAEKVAELSTKQTQYEQDNASLSSKNKELEREVSTLIADQATNKNTISDLENEIKKKEEEHAQRVDSLEKEQAVLENELKNKVMFLNTQLSQEVQTRESEKSALQQSSQREQSLASEVARQSKVIEVHQKELVEKLSELERKTKEQCELSLQFSNLKHSNEILRSEFDTFRDSAAETEKKLRKEIAQQNDSIESLNKDLDKSQQQYQGLLAELTLKDKLVAEVGSEKEKIAQEKEQEISKLVEEKAVKEQMVQEEMQKSESTILHSKQQHQSEIDLLSQRLAEGEEQCKQLEEDKAALDGQVEDLKSQIQTLELYLSEVNFKLDSKSSLCRKREEELEAAIAEHEKSLNQVNNLNGQVEHLKGQLKEKNAEVNQKSMESSNSQSLVSAKQQELENARTELTKCLQEIEHYKTQFQSKEQEVEAKDQEHQKLSEQYQQRDSEYKQMETKATGYEFKLKEAENRYRELEAKCHSLELQLEERFAHAQQGEKVLKKKEEERQDLISKLAKLEQDFNFVTEQVKNSEKTIAENNRQMKTLEIQCKKVEADQHNMEHIVAEKTKECDEARSQILSVNHDNEQLKEELTLLETKCAKLEQVEDKLAQTEKELDNNRESSEQLKEKLATAEAQMSSSSQQISELTGQLQLLREALERKDATHRDTESGLQSLEQQHLEAKIECQNLKSKVAYFQDMSSHTQSQFEESEEKRKNIELALDHSRAEVLAAQDQLAHMETSLSNLNVELQTSQQSLSRSQEEINHLVDKVKDLEKQNNDLNQVNAQMFETDATLRVDLAEKVAACSSLQDEAEAMAEKLKETSNNYSRVDAELAKMTQENNSLLQENASLEEKLKEAVADKEIIVADNQETLNQVRAEKEQLQLQSIEAINNLSLTQAEHSQHARANEDLRAQVTSLENTIADNRSNISDLEDRYSNLRIQNEELLTKVNNLENEKAAIEAENNSLTEEVERLSIELEDLKKKFDTSQASMQQQLDTSSATADDFKVEVTRLTQELEETLNRKGSLEKVCSEYERELVIMKEKEKSFEANKDQHVVEREALECRLKEAESMCHELKADLDRMKEEVSKGSQVSTELEEQLKEKSSDNEDLKLQLQKLENTVHRENSEKEEKIIDLLNKIDAFKLSDKAYEEKLELLDKELLDVKEREHRLSHRVEELEVKEKELLEQIADIEATVIVPLETENQELRDEVGIIKEERDEALAKVGKWEEEGGQDEEAKQATENVHKCLEDALEQREELEKKVGILMEDIGKLEAERDTMRKTIADLHSSKEDMADKCEELEVEMERLMEMERQSSVVEESETRLMDRVLDLEEREHQLSSELQGLKDKRLKSMAIQTEEAQSYTDLAQKVNYLEQKVEVLQEAEGKYMDTIIELEESKGRLQAQLLEHKDGITPEQATLSSNSKEVPSPVHEQISASTTFTTYAKINLDKPAADSTHSADSHPELFTTGDLLHSHDSNMSNEEISKLLSNNQTLVQEMNEKDNRIKDLEVKLQLLQDSESKLMERLLEIEEHSEKDQSRSAASEESKSFAQAREEDTLANELKKKIEMLTEENEFLAGNVESYKQLYKEEKEKINVLHERALEDGALVQELEEAREEMEALQRQLEETQDEQARQLREKEEREAKLKSLVEQGELTKNQLHNQLLDLQDVESHYQQLNDELRERATQLQKQLHDVEEKLLDSQHREHDLQQQVHPLKEKEAHLQQQVNSSHANESALEQQLQDSQASETALKEHVQDLERQLDASDTREMALKQQVQHLEKQVQELRCQLEEAPSGVGVLGDGHKASTLPRTAGRVRSPSSVLEETFHSSKAASVNLARPSGATSPPQITSKPAHSARRVAPDPPQWAGATPSPSHAHSPAHSNASSPPPVAPPRQRGRRSRPTSIDSVSQEELVFLVEELQAREAVLKKRVVDLEAITDVDLPQRVDELERENRDLQLALDQSRGRESTPHRAPPEPHAGPLHKDEEAVVGSTYVSLANPSYFYAGGDSNNNSSCNNNNNNNNDISNSGSISSRNNNIRGQSATMLDKPGDVLQQRVKELEHLDTINRNQLSELERDREVLHEIARKDKATIHDLNVRIRELQLSERSLKEQVNSLEVSESSLFSRCEDLDASRARLEDRVHELEVHERRLRELVRRLKLDEERWLGRSGGMETALGELSASESQLKRLLQDSEMEKGGLAERSSYMEARVRELEAVEASLTQKVKSLQSSEANLQKKLSQLENSEAAAHSKAGELDVLNADLSQRLQAGLEERAMLAQHMQQLHGQIQELDRRLLASRDSELAYKQHVESLQKNESTLQKRVREFELREIDSQARVRELEQTHEILGDKMAALQRSENRLKYRVQELEGMGGQIPGELTPTQKQKVPQKLEDCQKRVVALQNHVENLQMQLRENLKHSQQELASKDDVQSVLVPVSELSELRARSTLLEESNYQMQELEHLNEELNDTILMLREGKGASGREVEVEVLKRRLASYKACFDKLKSSLSPGQATSLVDPEQDSGPDGETLPARRLRGLESERVLQSVRGLEDGKANGLPGSSSRHGLTPQGEILVQSKTVPNLSSAPLSLDLSFGEDSSAASFEADQVRHSHRLGPAQEESHWRAIEARGPGGVAGSPRGGGASHKNTPLPKPVLHAGKLGGGGANASTLHHPGVTAGLDGRVGETGVSTPETEEVTVAMHLQSESELSSHHTHHHSSRANDSAQNDTDSSLSPVPPPRRSRKAAGTKGPAKETSPHHGNGGEEGVNYNNTNNISSSSHNSGDGSNKKTRAPPPPPTADSEDVVAMTTNQKLFFGEGQKKPLPHQPASSKGDHPVAEAGASSQKRPTSRAPLASFGGQDSFYLPSPAQDGGDSLEDDDDPPPPLPTSRPPGSEGPVAEGSGSPGSRSATPVGQPGRRDSLDTSTSGMSIRQRIAMIEKQLQSDQFDSKVDADHDQYWKKQASESLKQVELLEKDNKHMKEDINKLEKELEEKRRHINTLESWLSSLDDLLKNKNKQTDREMVEQLHLDLTKLKTELKKVGHRPEGDLMDAAALRTELEHRDRDIVSKRTELQALAQELHKWKDECRNIEGMRRTALDSLRSLEQEVVNLQEKERKLEESQEELEELKTKTEKTREVFEENLLLREKVHQGELELRRLRGLCDDFNNLSARYEEQETIKQQALDKLQPVQAQSERLARKCQQKDALLLDLGDELRHNSIRHSQAMDELERMERGMALEEYNTDFPHLINGPRSQPVHSQHRVRYGPSRSSSMEELDTHFNPLVNGRDRRKRPTPYVNNRPRSADGILNSGHLDRIEDDSHYQGHTQLLYQTVARETRRGMANSGGGSDGKFRVIADYDPSLFSQSGRPGLELDLVEGDVVTVTGPMDRTGYYEAEVNGRAGLVPANYLLPLQGAGGHGLLPRPGRSTRGQRGDESPEHILEMFNQLQHGAPLQRSQAPRATGLPADAWPPTRRHQQAAPVPDPPCNLHVREGDDGDGTYLLSWQPPQLDARGCNNGLQVLGYMVYVDNQEYEQVPSAGLCEVLLEGLRPDQSHTLAVQALCGGGQASHKAQLLFQGVVRGQGQSRGRRRSQGHLVDDDDDERDKEREPHQRDTDLSSVLDKLQYKKGHKRKVLAMYDYSPDHESPGDYPHLELAFLAGDMMTVYGEPRPDGFLHGEIGGKRGLVPACFVEDVSESPREAQRVPTRSETKEMTL